MYLAWYDASRKLTVQEKIENAYARYVTKFGNPPAEVLINPAIENDLLHTLRIPLLLVPRDHIAPNCFWIGTSEDNT